MEVRPAPAEAWKQIISDLVRDHSVIGDHTEMQGKVLRVATLITAGQTQELKSIILDQLKSAGKRQLLARQ